MQRFQHRHLWSVKESEVENGPGGGGLTYQYEDSTEVPVQAHEANVRTRLRRDRQEPVLVDAAVVEGIKRKRKMVVDGHESEDDEGSADHTMLQYYSDDEGNRTGHRVPVIGIDDDE